MDELWRVLLQFVFRLSFGIAVAMVVTPTRWVNAGFYRVHLWVLMGLSVFGSLAAYSQRTDLMKVGIPSNFVLGMAIAAALVSYVGAVIWLYEAKRPGGIALVLVVALTLAGGLAICLSRDLTTLARGLFAADTISSGLLLGTNMTAMLLGHWYLNHPGMRLEPLQRLVLMIGGAIAFRTIVNAIGLVCEVNAITVNGTFWIFVAFRWLAGLVGTAVMAVMTWQTLKIPNTQSATGILYAGVIVSFLGELTSQLLSISRQFPI